MNRVTVLSVVLLVGMFCSVRPSFAEPAWGGNCLACHGDWQGGLVGVWDEDTTADPDESGTGAPDRGTLKVFRAYRGETRDLTSEVLGLNSADTFAVEMTRFHFSGVEHGAPLAHSPDCAWPEWGEPAGYYTQPYIRYVWDSDPTEFAYAIDIEADAPLDYYDLVVAVAGKSAADGALFYSEEHFYLQVVIAGDLDDDGDVQLDDYATFQGCLNGPEVTEPPPGCEAEDFANADFDRDGDVDLGDFATFADNFTD